MRSSIFWKRPIPYLFGILIAGLAIGILMPLILSNAPLGRSFLATALVAVIMLLMLVLAWRMAGGGKKLFWMMLIAFLLRLAVGIFFAWGLPRFGYPEDGQLAGYFYSDAFTRDSQAWSLAVTGEPLARAFGGELVSDQYGGLLAMSALVYRLFSPDAHRPYLILIITAAVSAIGLPFLLSAGNCLLKKKYSTIAGWILVFFPDAVLLGATQMREPFMITAFIMCFWAVITWKGTKNRLFRVLAMIVGLVLMLVISTRSAVLLLAFIFIALWIEGSQNLSKKWIRVAGWVILGLVVILLAGLSWAWLRDVMRWDMLLAYRASGWIELIFDSTPKWLHAPFLIVYGIFQPVLPAAIADPAPWIWQVSGIFRGLGWYAMLPFLVYGLIITWKADDKNRKMMLSWLIISIWAWILISSARAGGDQWDNPRYRMMLIPWMSLIAAYVLQWSKDHQSRWFWRWVMVEGVFLLFFTHWYIGRYAEIYRPIPFPIMLALITGISGVVMLGGWLLDQRRDKGLRN